MTNDNQSSAWLLKPSPSPWGDYGRILFHGMSRHLRRSGGRIQLERTGPFVPPMTFPAKGDIVVTDTIRAEIDAQSFVGVSFEPVDLARIVRLDWQRWDRGAAFPPVRPRGGEPEAYVLGGVDDRRLATQVGALWKLVGANWGTSSSALVSR